MLLSFHTLAAGAYPLSLSGAHFSQQLYKVDPTSGSLSRDYYREFYADSFEDGQVGIICLSIYIFWSLSISFFLSRSLPRSLML